MRTKGMCIVSAEISPTLRHNIEQYRLVSKAKSNSDVVREALTEFFLKKLDLKELRGDTDE